MPPDLSPELVRNIRSPHSTGDEWPVPGSSTFQFRSESVRWLGMVVAWLMPVPFGPRKRVHSWAGHGNTPSATLMTRMTRPGNTGAGNARPGNARPGNVFIDLLQ